MTVFLNSGSQLRKADACSLNTDRTSGRAKEKSRIQTTAALSDQISSPYTTHGQHFSRRPWLGSARGSRVPAMGSSEWATQRPRFLAPCVAWLCFRSLSNGPSQTELRSCNEKKASAPQCRLVNCRISKKRAPFMRSLRITPALLRGVSFRFPKVRSYLPRDVDIGACVRIALAPLYVKKMKKKKMDREAE